VAGRTEYTFGDTGTASDRLALVHRVFAAPSAALLARVGGLPRVVVDLGCGPGHTTALLHDRFPDARVIGVEQSAAFAAEARERVPEAEIVVSDATSVALPAADIVYCRLLLAHLPDVAGAIARWRSQLSPHGLLVLDEVESIQSDDATFRRYEEIVWAMVGARGASVSAGPRIATALVDDSTRIAHDAVVRFEVAPADAAAMFAMNLATWRYDDWVRAHVDAGELDDLAAALARPDERGTITWYLRQVIVGPPA
jgi:SAM-dependent methyltransferase